ncbi:MAG: hypothetical protein KF770_32190 [Anaerolineae bacterium]|nr:hypothetical protein [Anaerolineae bacterium]
MPDCIAVLEAGSMVEYGPHVALLAHVGQYAWLYTMQAEKYEYMNKLANPVRTNHNSPDSA